MEGTGDYDNVYGTGKDNGEAGRPLLQDYGLRLEGYHPYRLQELFTPGRYDRMELIGISKKLWSDHRELVLTIVKQCWYAFGLASEAIRSDREMLLEFLELCGEAWGPTSEEFWSNRPFICEMLKKSGDALEAFESIGGMVFDFAGSCPLESYSEKFRSNRPIMLEVIKKSGRALRYVSEGLGSDREFVVEAVKQNALALQWASETWKSDREVVMGAVKEHGGAYKFASEDLRADRDIMLWAARRGSDALEYPLRNDAKFRAAVDTYLASDDVHDFPGAVFTAEQIVPRKYGRWTFHARTMAGEEVTVDLPPRSTLDDLARIFVARHARCTHAFIAFPSGYVAVPADGSRPVSFFF